MTKLLDPKFDMDPADVETRASSNQSSLSRLSRASSKHDDISEGSIRGMHTSAEVQALIFKGLTSEFGDLKSYGAITLLPCNSDATMARFEKAIGHFHGDSKVEESLLQIALVLESFWPAFEVVGAPKQRLDDLRTVVNTLKDPEAIKEGNFLCFLHMVVASHFRNEQWEQFGRDIGTICKEVLCTLKKR